MEEDVRRKVAENIGLLIDVAQLMHIPIVVTEQYPRGLGQVICINLLKNSVLVAMLTLHSRKKSGTLGLGISF